MPGMELVLAAGYQLPGSPSLLQSPRQTSLPALPSQSPPSESRCAVLQMNCAPLSTFHLACLIPSLGASTPLEGRACVALTNSLLLSAYCVPAPAGDAGRPDLMHTRARLDAAPCAQGQMRALGSTPRLPHVWYAVGTARIQVTGPTPQFCLLHPHCRLSTASPRGCRPRHCALCTPAAQQQHPECKEATPRLPSGFPKAEGHHHCKSSRGARPQVHPVGCLLWRKCPALRRSVPEVRAWDHLYLSRRHRLLPGGFPGRGTQCGPQSPRRGWESAADPL